MLIRLMNITLRFGVAALLDSVSLRLAPKTRVALVGRNGVGKSTLLKLLSGEIKQDEGEIEYATDIQIHYLPQSIPEMSGTVREIMASPLLATREPWAVNAAVDKYLFQMKLQGDELYTHLSGGYKRRVLIARAMMTEPDLLILDEPTNHLDIDSILWLERLLDQWRGGLLFVSHDRGFIRSQSQKILDLDRGQLTLWDCGYEEYLKRKAESLHAESLEQKRFDKKLAEEEAWIRQGIKARRTRNEGRVRALKQLRLQRAERREQLGKAKLQVSEAESSGKKVIEVTKLRYKNLIHDFSCVISRGDKIGLIGPNGCGKTTLINILLKQLQPDEGSVQHGTKLEIAYFDQLRAQVDPAQTVETNVGGGRSHIEFQGKSIHVMSYLQQFLFTPAQARSPVSVLSGGERNRLLLAKLFTNPANFLVLDEPTNDLDIETLELLEELLCAFNGTVLTVSHDREFLNNVVTSIFAFTGNGRVEEFIGGYDDAVSQAQQLSPAQEVSAKKRTKADNKVSNRDRNELKKLPDKIARVEQDIESLHQALSEPTLYTEKPDKAESLAKELKEKESELDALFARWEELEAKG